MILKKKGYDKPSTPNNSSPAAWFQLYEYFYRQASSECSRTLWTIEQEQFNSRKIHTAINQLVDTVLTDSKGALFSTDASQAMMVLHIL